MTFSLHSNLAFQTTCEIRRIQENLLNSHLQYVMRNSQFYKERLAGIDLSNPTFDTLALLPFTDKIDFEQENQKLIACQHDQIVDTVHTSGTSGHPTYVVYTDNDLKRLEYNEIQALSMSGITNSDTVLLSCTMERCFIAGLAYFLGLD